MPAGSRILLYGGSFNPVHHGHLLIALHAAERLQTDRVVLIPSARPPHKSVGLAEPQHRLAMLQAAVAGAAGFEISDCELARPGPSYTFDTVMEFHRQQPQAELFWLIGLDSLGELVTWYRIQELVELCTFVTVARPGYSRQANLERLASLFTANQIERIEKNILEDGPQISLSSRELRARAAAGRSLRWAVPEAVCSYIDQHGLYRDGN